MGHPTKIGFFLAFLVFGVYIMRNADVSVGSTTTRAFRALYSMASGSPTWYSSAGTSICPDVNIDAPFTDSEVSAAASAKSSIQGMRGGNPLKVTLESGSLSNFGDYAMGLAPLAGAWIVLFVITYLICCSLCCSWCCMHGCCKKTKCCKCCKQPQIFKKKWIYVGVTVVMLLGMFSAGIAGASFSGKVPKGMQVTLCSFIGMVEDFITGIPDAKWMGLSGVGTSLTNIYNLYDAALTAMGATADAVTQVKTDRDQANTDLTSIYTTNSAATVTRADPNNAGTYKPDYIANLGPTSSSSTNLGSIYAEFDTQYQILKAAQDIINPAVNNLNTNKNDIKSGIDTGKSVVGDVQKAMDGFLDTLGGIGSTVNDIFSAIGSALVAIFVVFIVIAVLVILSILVIIKKKVKFLNKFLHFSWCVLILLNLITWLVSAVFYPVSVVMMEACDVLDSLLTDSTSRSNILSSITSGSTVDVFSTCLNAKDSADPDADFAGPFKIKDSLKDFDNIYDQLDTVTKTFTITGSTGNTGPASVTIPFQTNYITTIVDGTIVDHANTVTDLAQLNRLVNKNTMGSCTTLLDSWQLKSSQCSGTKFAAGDANTASKGSQICMGLTDIWIPNGKSATARYSGDFGTCSNVGASPASTYIPNLANNFVTNRNDLKNLLDNGGATIKNLLATTITTDYNTFKNDVGSVLNNFGKIKAGLASIQDALTGPQNGVLNNLKCGFVKTDLLRISNGMCTGFVSNLYQTSVSLIVTSFFTLFSAVAIFLLAKRILLPEYMAAKTSPSGFSPPGNQFSPY